MFLWGKAAVQLGRKFSNTPYPAFLHVCVHHVFIPLLPKSGQGNKPWWTWYRTVNYKQNPKQIIRFWFGHKAFLHRDFGDTWPWVCICNRWKSTLPVIITPPHRQPGSRHQYLNELDVKCSQNTNKDSEVLSTSWRKRKSLRWVVGSIGKGPSVQVWGQSLICETHIKSHAWWCTLKIKIIGKPEKNKKTKRHLTG